MKRCLSACLPSRARENKVQKHTLGKAASIFLGTVQQKTDVGGRSTCEMRQSMTQNRVPPLPISISMLSLGSASASSAPHPAELKDVIAAAYGAV